MSERGLSGRVALVTGGTRGIGLATAQALAGAGATVLVTSRGADAVEAAVASLTASGAVASGIAANVGKPEDRERLVSACRDRYGRLDILVNNAAANPVFGPVEDTEPWAFDKIMSVNVHAPFELARLALPLLEASTPGHIVNVSSIGGLRPEPQLGIYSVSKAALNQLTRVLAKEWGPRGVHVNAVCPGLVKTDFSQALWSNERTVCQFERHTPLGRVAEPREIADLILAVVGSAGGYATGQLFVADGGYTI